VAVRPIEHRVPDGPEHERDARDTADHGQRAAYSHLLVNDIQVLSFSSPILHYEVYDHVGGPQDERELPEQVDEDTDARPRRLT